MSFNTSLVSLHAPEVARAALGYRRRAWHRFQTSFRRMFVCIFWTLGFKQSSFHHVAQVEQRPTFDVFAMPAALLPCCCPRRTLSAPGKALGPAQE
jgi:hypothetical protein